MTMEEQHNTLKAQLEGMGYSNVDAERAVVAGAKDANQAVEYLVKLHAKSPLEDTTMNFPSLSEAHATSSATSSQVGHGVAAQIRGLTNARDSLDGINVTRVSGEAPTPGQTGSDVQMTKDFDLERAKEISLKELDEEDQRHIAEVMELSKNEEAASRQRAEDEDQGYFRAVKESLKENPRGTTTDRAVSWQSPGYADVKERMRNSLDEPVGLRNIGNTCYLNSLLQVYFHLPDFRRAIMAFRPPEHILNPPFTQNSFVPVDACAEQPVVETPEDDDLRENESIEERAERKIAANQLDQSWGVGLVKGPDGTSGMSDNHVAQNEDDCAVQNAVHFVVELQKLFAAMALGNENCADPSGVVHTMRDPNGIPIVIGAQQDAYEFNHLFLDIVERGLRSETEDNESVEGEKVEREETKEQNESESQTHKPVTAPVAMEDSKGSENIVKNLFTLHFRQELRSCPADSSTDKRKDSAGTGEDRDCPVTIRQCETTNEIVVNATSKDYRNLHSGLDDYAFTPIEYEVSQSLPDVAMAPSGLESFVVPTPEGRDAGNCCTSPTTTKSVWFTRMPPVMVIYLQRATYNKETSQAEKVHERYDFPCEISFDRYLEKNKEASVRARDMVQKIRSERERLHALHQRYRTFPRGEDVKEHAVNGSAVVEMDLSGSDPQLKQQETAPKLAEEEVGLQQHNKNSQAMSCESIFDSATRIQARLLESVNTSSPLFAVEGLSRDRVQTSLEVLNAVMEHDRKKCDTYEAEIGALCRREERAYQGLDKEIYRLHAVLVHDGAPSGGHYWTFIRNWSASSGDSVWMRLSDSSVTYVTEDDMLSWSVGGKSRASAYCLIYMVESSLGSNYKLESTHESEFKAGETISEESRRLLPRDRIEEVERASSEFAKELEEQEGPRYDFGQ